MKLTKSEQNIIYNIARDIKNKSLSDTQIMYTELNNINLALLDNKVDIYTNIDKIENQITLNKTNKKSLFA